MGAVAKSFPGALPGQIVDLVTNQVLRERGFDKANTIFAHSTCPDEINANDTSDDLVVLLKRRWKGAFPLGGLAGLPFAGKTGWGAFSAHVPEEGKIILLFAPHVGISETGVVGYVGRRGQSGDSSACGAALGALASCTAGNAIPDDPFDYQMSFITGKVKERVQEINAADCPNASVTHALYDVQVDFLRNMLAAVPPKFEIAVLGGIQINLTDPEPDHFMPLMFDLLTPNGSDTSWPFDTTCMLASLTDFLPGTFKHVGSFGDPDQKFM